MYLLMILSAFGSNVDIVKPEIYTSMKACVERARPLNKTKNLKAWCIKLPTEESEESKGLALDCQKCVTDHLKCLESLIDPARKGSTPDICNKAIDKCSKKHECNE